MPALFFCYLFGFFFFSVDEIEDIYQVLPELIEMWGMNVQTQAESKKNTIN